MKKSKKSLAETKHRQKGCCAGKLNLKIGCRHRPKNRNQSNLRWQPKYGNWQVKPIRTMAADATKQSHQVKRGSICKRFKRY